VKTIEFFSQFGFPMPETAKNNLEELGIKWLGGTQTAMAKC
jgi:phage-related holin